MAVKDIRADELRKMLREEPEQIEIVDVRSRTEYEQVHIRGSRLIPVEELHRRFGEIDWVKNVVFVCRSGRRSQLMAGMASAAGMEVRNLRFGIFECFREGKGEFLEGSLGGRERYF